MPIEGAEVLNGEHIKDASSQYGATSEMGAAGYYVQLELTTEGQQAFYAATAANVGQPIGQVLKFRKKPALRSATACCSPP